MSDFAMEEADADLPPPTRNYRLACAHEEMNPRRRNTMEDVHRIIPSLPGAPEYAYFGVYDGHGGRQIVDFLEEGLETNVSNELQQPDDAGILDRLTRAFLITDMHSRRLNITTSGATAVCALLKKDFSEDGSGEVVGKMLYVANVGDSRAVIVMSDSGGGGSGYKALRLSYDHRAEDEGEQRRIKDAGGFITKARVLGILAVSRSFGDHGMKDFVTADPYVTATDLLACAPDGSKDCPFLILACDGVWDVLSDQEAADLVLLKFKEKGPFEGAAKLLVDTAIEKGSADNVTAIVVFL
jgi:serine/threonine protein phosphatase PrpC